MANRAVDSPAGPAVTGSAKAAAVTPFQFRTSLILQQATGLRAATLTQLAALLREVPEGCIYFHTHHFLLAHHYLTPGPANDLAYWVTDILGEEPLGERLSEIDVMAYASLAKLREALVQTIEAYLLETPTAHLRFASEGQEFFFVTSIHVILPCASTASTLEEFGRALQRLSPEALYFHMFDARLRLKRPTNDFSLWLREQLRMPELAARIEALDPYATSLTSLRATLVALVGAAARGAAHAGA